jgi:hypothetical protein
MRPIFLHALGRLDHLLGSTIAQTIFVFRKASIIKRFVLVVGLSQQPPQSSRLVPFPQSLVLEHVTTNELGHGVRKRRIAMEALSMGFGKPCFSHLSCPRQTAKPFIAPPSPLPSSYPLCLSQFSFFSHFFVEPHRKRSQARAI